MARGLLCKLGGENQMTEISPVLAGTYNSTDYAPASVNFTSGAPDGGAVDPRRYTQFDRTASQVGDATLSFGDVLDMLNPLQHIPVVSSVYREITGDTINPVSRVAGDILYGGVLGIASALASGIGAVGDSVMEAKTGKDITGTVYASLFGEDTAGGGNGTQIAAAENPPAPAPQQTAQTATVSTGDPQPAQVASAQIAQGIPLARNKLPYGGVMAPVRSPQEQNMALSLAAATGGIHIGNKTYANRIGNGARSVSSAPSASATAPAQIAANSLQPALATPLPAPHATMAETPEPGMPDNMIVSLLPASPIPAAGPKDVGAANAAETTIPQALSDDVLIMKALGLYRSVAERAAAGNAGGTIN
jgi:hypothetical protein